MKRTNKNLTESTQKARKERLHCYVRGMDVIADMIRETLHSIEVCGTSALCDDHHDPLARLAGLVDSLKQIVSWGRRLAEEDAPEPRPEPVLALELRKGADRLSGMLPRLKVALAHYRTIRDSRAIHPVRNP
jgi:hypothetical protein